MTELTLDYPRLWKTLLRTGIKERFSQIRLEFFMKIATDGARVYSTNEERQKIIEDSETFAVAPGLVEYLNLGIPEGIRFKHYNYVSPEGELFIEYFANLESGVIPKELVDFFTKEDEEKNYHVDGHCVSMRINNVDVVTKKSTEDGEDDGEVCDNRNITAHLILIAEGTDGHIYPELYPVIIKHELTHACLFELRNLIQDGYFDNMNIPVTWSEEDTKNWESDIKYLLDTLNEDDEECSNFCEFVCEFLMYESDGSIKVKNPIREIKPSKSGKQEPKPKVTYRTVTPFDRFEETIETMDDTYQKTYEPILETLRDFYEDYDAFLGEIRR